MKPEEGQYQHLFEYSWHDEVLVESLPLVQCNPTRLLPLIYDLKPNIIVI